ncbi:neprilysin-11-like [Anabrus simplex]|uniref:neprilysin-11-like n=1 Tax=Anabrus simplex TaxID=316456 RepID=UPI0035A2A474
MPIQDPTDGGVADLSSSFLHLHGPVGLFLFGGNTYPESKEENAVCQTAVCYETAKDILQSLNTSVDPCEDFYRFSCEGWINRNPVAPTESYYDQFDIVNAKLSLQIKGILEEGPLPSEPTPVTKAKKFYAACMDTGTVQSEGLHILNGILEELGGWPIIMSQWTPENFNLTRVMGIMIRKYAIPSLFRTYVHMDYKNSSRYIIVLDQILLSLPRSLLTEPKTYSQFIEAYRQFIAQTAILIAKSRNETIPSESLFNDTRDIVEFEAHLAQLSSPNEKRRDPYRLYNIFTLEELGQWTYNWTESSTGMVNWMNFLREVFRDVKDVELSYNEPIIVKEVDYIFSLLRLLHKTPVRVIANYLHWRTVQYFSRDINKEMSALSFEFDKILHGAKEDPERWLHCTQTTSGSLNFAVGYKYIGRFFDKASRKRAMEMVQSIRGSFIAQVQAIDWMDDWTRREAVEKAESILELIGYPDSYTNETALEEYYKGVTVTNVHMANLVTIRGIIIHRSLSRLRMATDRNEWAMGPDVVNAYYSPQTNAVVFPAGILQAPFFSIGRPEALNYGSMGVVIGHEMTHGFDDVGRQYDRVGNLAQWWTEPTVDTYLKKAECFVEQYEQFKFPELDELHENTTINGRNTEGENIADNGGLRQAFNAYQEYVKQNGPEELLPGLEKFSSEQLFFLGFSTVWCQSINKKALLHQVLTDSHSPHKIRVQATLSNSEEFARVWNCPLKSSMNPIKKCSIW